MRVLSESSFPLLVDPSLFILVVLLVLDDLHELLAFGGGLLMESQLFVKELPLSGFFQIGQKSLLLFIFELFDYSEFSFTLFEGSLGAESVDISLSVGCLLLHLPELLHFPLLFLSDTSLHLLSLELGLLFLLYVAEYSLVLLLLSQLLFFFEGERHLVGDFDLLQYGFGFLSFYTLSLDLFLFYFPDLLFQDLSLSIDHLSFLLSDHGSLLDLLDQYAFPLVGGCDLSFLALFLLVEGLEPLDLHHQVKLLLLLDELLLELLVFLDLLVANGNDLGVKDHLIHLLDIVKLFVHQHLGFRQETLRPLLLLKRERTWRKLALSLPIELRHLVFLYS